MASVNTQIELSIARNRLNHLNWMLEGYPDDKQLLDEKKTVERKIGDLELIVNGGG
jgi:hypothetical protein